MESHLQCDYHRPFLAQQQQQPEKEQQPATATGRCIPSTPGLLPPSIAATATATVRPSSSPIAPNRVAVVYGQPRYPRLRNRFLRSTFRLVLFRCLACPVLSCRANPTLSYLILSYPVLSCLVWSGLPLRDSSVLRSHPLASSPAASTSVRAAYSTRQLQSIIKHKDFDASFDILLLLARQRSLLSAASIYSVLAPQTMLAV